MGAAIVVILLVGLVLPISMLLLALIFDALSILWVAYVLSRDEWKRMNRFVGKSVARLHIPARLHHAPLVHH